MTGCAAFSKESGIRFANALHRKSGGVSALPGDLADPFAPSISICNNLDG